MRDETQTLISMAIDGTISRADFERLQDLIDQSDEVRAEYLRAVSVSETLCEIATQSSESVEPAAHDAAGPRTSAPTTPTGDQRACAEFIRRWPQPSCCW